MKKNLNKKKVAAVLAVSTLALLTGCGSSNNNGNVAGVPGAGTGGYPGGCMPLTSMQAIGFQATNASFSATDERLKAGYIPADAFDFHPSPETVGTVIVSGAAIASPPPGIGGAATVYGMSQYTGSSFQATITPPIAPTAGNYPTMYGTVNISGSITIPAMLQQYLMMVSGNGFYGMGGIGYPQFPGQNFPGSVPQYPVPYGSPYTNPYPNQTSSICVSGIAVNLQQLGGYNSTQLGMGAVYLYFNGQTQHGIALPF
jgi:hypothetical protein